MTDTSAFILDAHRIFRAMTIARADPVREYLGGVRIEPIEEGGVWMIATNGSIMLIQRDKDGRAAYPGTLAVSAKNWVKDQYDCEDGDEDAARIHVPALTCGETVAAPIRWGAPGYCDVHVLVERLPDCYPDWRQAIGAPLKKSDIIKEHTKNAIGGDLMSLLIQDRYAFRLHGDLDSDAPMLITYSDDHDSLGVILPCNVCSDLRPDGLLKAIARGDLVKPNQKEKS